jgi:hypothetical protein
VTDLAKPTITEEATKQSINWNEIWGFYSDGDSSRGLLSCEAAWLELINESAKLRNEPTN